MREHSYQTFLKWTGNQGQGTRSYQAYSRAYEIEVQGKPIVFGSADPAFRGDKTRYNPEELLVASLSSCHLLWYLHLCAEEGVIVVDYHDQATGTMNETKDGSGRFTKVTLQPKVLIAAENSLETAKQLHDKAHQFCFIANSVNFPVFCQPLVKRKE